MSARGVSGEAIYREVMGSDEHSCRGTPINILELAGELAVMEWCRPDVVQRDETAQGGVKGKRTAAGL